MKIGFIGTGVMGTGDDCQSAQGGQSSPDL